MIEGLATALNRQRQKELLAAEGWTDHSMRMHRRLMNAIQSGREAIAASLTAELCRTRFFETWTH
jgi:hypothetical protein